MESYKKNRKQDITNILLIQICLLIFKKNLKNIKGKLGKKQLIELN